MKKNNKGFTLVELLAVIVVLSIILIIAGSSLTGTKEKANIEEAKKLEKMIEDLGPVIYSDEKINGGTMMGYSALADDGTKEIDLANLKSHGYLKSEKIQNPAGGDDCEGYLLVEKTNNGPKFTGKICCPNLYETGADDVPENCDGY